VRRQGARARDASWQHTPGNRRQGRSTHPQTCVIGPPTIPNFMMHPPGPFSHCYKVRLFGDEVYLTLYRVLGGRSYSSCVILDYPPAQDVAPRGFTVCSLGHKSQPFAMVCGVLTEASVPRTCTTTTANRPNIRHRLAYRRSRRR
jgi:hypothetical protein